MTAHGAGRTDAGVHALGQVAHVDLERDWAPFRLSEGLNALLHPHPVAVLGVERVSEDFDARHSASARHYLYRIVNRRAPLTFERGQAWRVKPRLDAAAMHAAARVLIGRHDFSTFRDSQCQAKSPVRTLDRLDVRRDGDEILFEAGARSFLHRQVRSMVGSLVEVGTGRWSAEANSRRRSRPPIAAAAARWRPRTASIWFGWTIPKRSARSIPPPQRRGRGTARRAVVGARSSDESATDNHCQRPSSSPRAVAAGSAALERIASTSAWIAGLSPATSHRSLCARFLLRKGAARRRDRRHESRCRRSPGARPSPRCVA